jgi:transcription antitermination factor NusG
MGAFHAEPNWFALRVRPNHEQTAESGLVCRGLEAYLPRQRVRRRWSDRIKETEAVLFPGYVFCRFDYADRLHVLNSPGVRSIVAMGREPAPVEESEISAIRALVASGRPILPWPYVRIGQEVVIRDGPLASLRGVVLRIKDAWRVVVSVEALSCSVAVELDVDLVAPRKPAAFEEPSRERMLA